MQEINTTQNLIPLAQFTPSKNGDGTAGGRGVKRSRKDLETVPTVTYFSVIMYCTIQFRMLPYTRKPLYSV